MASNTNTTRYKQVGRQARIQTREGNFSGGMLFSDKPMSDGYNKVLVNYDIDSTDGTIKSRKGYQTYLMYTEDRIKALPLKSANSTVTYKDVWGSIVDTDATFLANLQSMRTDEINLDWLMGRSILVDYKIVTTHTGPYNKYLACLFLEQYYNRVLIVYIPYGADPAIGSTFKYDLRVGILSTGTLPNTEQEHSIMQTFIPRYLDIDKMYGDNRYDDPVQVCWTDPGYINLNPIAGQRASHSYAAKLLGTFAWNQNYYYFTKHKDAATNKTVSELHYTGLPELNAFDENTKVVHPLNIAPLDIQGVTRSLYSYKVEPYQPNPAEAATSGFNMLLNNPYAFKDGHGAMRILGVLPYEQGDLNKIILEPIINKNMTLRCYYSAPSSLAHPYRIKWEWREVGATEWTLMKEEIRSNFENLEMMTCDFMSPVEQLIVRVTITDTDPDKVVTDSKDNKIEYTVSTTSIGLNFKLEPSENLKTELYDLGTGKGMQMWQNRLAVWGVQGAENTVFVSSTDNPGYFPYPNNIDFFNENIIGIKVYGADLLVFTGTSIYRLTDNIDGKGWTKTLVQKNLNLKEEDVANYQIVKSMLYFKSGDYPYMLVPKSSNIVGDTTIAPIYNNVKQFYDHFHKHVWEALEKATQKNVLERLNGVYTTAENCLVHTYSYVKDYKIYTVYVYDMKKYITGKASKEYISAANYQGYNYSLERFMHYAVIYDTQSYTWSTQYYEAPVILYPCSLNNVGDTIFISLKYNDQDNNYGVYVAHQQCNYIYTKQTEDTKDKHLAYYTDSTKLVYTPDYSPIYKSSNSNKKVVLYNKNHQYLDTGYRILTSNIDIKKRFREMQISINNASQKALTFYTAFIVDGNLRKDMQGYTTKTIIDPEDPRTGILLVERPYIDPRYLPSVPELVVSVEDYINPDVTLGDTTLDDSFVLDNSQFPDLAYWKIRVDVSGKGYTPRLQLLSVNEQEYSILSLNWVYRTMNSR